MKGFAVQMIDTAKTTLKDGKLSDVFGAEIQGATDMLSKVKLGSKAAGVLAGTNHNLSSGTSLGYIGSASQSMQKEYNFIKITILQKRCPDLTFIDKAKIYYHRQGGCKCFNLP